MSIDLFGTKIEAAGEEDESKSLWDLQAEGQAELIKELSKRNSEDEKFASALNNKYIKGKSKTITDYTSKDVRLIFSISKKRNYQALPGFASSTTSFTLGDRIEYVKFDIVIPNNVNLSFVKWNKFSTEYATINVADVSFNRSLEVTASSGITNVSGAEKTVDNKKTTSSNSLTPTISGKGTTGIIENQIVRYRYVGLNGTISDKKASIEQEGIREIDLTGNVIADFNLKFDEFPETITSIEDYKAASGAYNAPKNLKVSLYTAMVPIVSGLPEKIEASLNYQYAYRHIVKGEKTYYEWDDKIEYITGTASKTITLFKRDDYLPSFYNISERAPDHVFGYQRTRIVLKDVHSNEETEMVFPDLAAAQEFWRWLNKHEPAPADVNKPIVIGSYKLLLRTGQENIDLTKNAFDAVKSKIQPLFYFR